MIRTQDLKRYALKEELEGANEHNSIIKDHKNVIAAGVETTITPLMGFDPRSIDIEYEELKLKATGYEADEVIKIIDALQSRMRTECAAPPLFGGHNLSNVDSLKSSVKGRIAEKQEGREKPLEINVDLLKDKARLPRMAEGFRCPNCGQAFITSIYSTNKTEKMWVFRDANNNNGENKPSFKKVNVEDIVVEEFANKDKLIELYKGLDKLTFEKVSLLYQEGVECNCPVCKETNEITKWIDAYSFPLEFFDADVICDICGDDAKITITENTQYAECEYNCLSKTVVVEPKSENMVVDDICGNCNEESCN